MDRDDRHQQQALVGTPEAKHRYRYCRRCGRELEAPESRFLGYGPDCDPTRRPRAAAVREVEQDALPGT